MIGGAEKFNIRTNIQILYLYDGHNVQCTATRRKLKLQTKKFVFQMLISQQTDVQHPKFDGYKVCPFRRLVVGMKCPQQNGCKFINFMHIWKKCEGWQIEKPYHTRGNHTLTLYMP
jgi:hypothetical protein